MQFAEMFPSELDKINIKNKYSNKKFFDYSRYLITKPWGEEFLIFQTKKIAVWLLKIHSKKSTSLHCHIYKKTILVPLSGELIVSSFLKNYKIKKKPIIVNKKTFHQTFNYSNKSKYLIEIETPNLKNDIIRFRDNYGRIQNDFKEESLNNSKINKFYLKNFKKNFYTFKKKLFIIEVNKNNIEYFYKKYKNTFFVVLKKIDKKFKEEDILAFNKKNAEMLKNSLLRKIALLIIKV